MAIVKKKTTKILCLHSSIVCSKNKEEEEKHKIKNTMKNGREEEKKPNDNLIFSHVNHTFFILDS
jgi:hypothetical protein